MAEANFNPDTSAATAAQAAADAAAAAKFQAQEKGGNPAVDAVINQVQNQGANNQQPDLIAGKFKTQDDLLAAYKALEAKLGAPKVEAPAVDAAKPAANPSDLSIDPNAAVAEAGVNMEALSAEYAEKGTLSEENFAKLAKVGINKDMVEAFAEGQKARAATMRAESFKAAGITEDSFSDMVKWAQTSLPREDIAAYNDAVGAKSSPAMQRFALEAMHTRFVKAQGQNPNLFNGQRGAAAGSDSYQSQEQMLADMRKPEYKKDPAFRNAVAAKVSRSRF